MTKNIVYIDLSQQQDTGQLITAIESWAESRLEGILIIDNCSYDFHQRIVTEIGYHPNVKFKILKLNFEPTKGVGLIPHLIKLQPESDDLIHQMLVQAYPIMPLRDLNRIVGFAQGFPQMAVLMSKSYLSDRKDLAQLNDDGLLERLVWGRGQVDYIGKAVIEVCSLFNEIGWKGSVKDQYKHIAIVANTTERNVYYWLEDFCARGVIQEQHTNYLQTTPKPLALRLAADWLRHCMPEVAIHFIENLPEELRDSFAEQFCLLDYLPKAQELVAELCQDNHILSVLDILKTHQGSQILSSAAEINPHAVVESIGKMLMSLDKMPNYPDASITIFIYTLEKLCFRKETFTLGANLLVKLVCLLQNMPHQPLAQRYFTRFFQVTESGTEADLAQRFDVLATQISNLEPIVQDLIIKSLGQIFIQPPKRYGSPDKKMPENQGSGKVLQEWAPASPEDVTAIQIYKQKAFSMLVDISCETTTRASFAYQQIIIHLKNIVSAGLLNEAITRRITSKHGNELNEKIADIHDPMLSISPTVPTMFAISHKHIREEGTSIAAYAAIGTPPVEEERVAKRTRLSSKEMDEMDGKNDASTKDLGGGP